MIPPLDKSAWSTRIDWYLGFQLRRGVPHKRFEFSNDIRQLMESYEAPLPRIPRLDSAPLMVASETRLPNHQTVLIPEADSTQEWAKSCHRIWRGLGRPPTRVFLPKGVTRDQFERAWPREPGESSERRVTPESADLQIVSS